MKACDDFWIENWKMNILHIIWLFTLKKIAEKFSIIQLFDKFKNIKIQMTIIYIYVFSIIVIAILNYVLIFTELVTKILNI